MSRGVTWTVTILALACLIGTQALWDTAAAPAKAAQKEAAILIAEPAIPSLTALKFLSLNQRSAVADLLWLQTIQYFGEGNPYGKYPSLGALLDTVTSLDPKFNYPYAFGMVVLPFMDQTATAVKIGERAQTAIPNDGLLTFYLASTYHLDVKDYKKAGDLYNKASTEPGAPSASKELAGVAYSSATDSLSDRLVAMAFWQTVYNNAQNDTDRTEAISWYKHMQIVYDLEVAAQKYRTDKGAYPADLQAMKDAGYISDIPISPIGRALILDPNTGRIDFSNERA